VEFELENIEPEEVVGEDEPNEEEDPKDEEDGEDPKDDEEDPNGVPVLEPLIPVVPPFCMPAPGIDWPKKPFAWIGVASP
jgi:hypothetical protein